MPGRLFTALIVLALVAVACGTDTGSEPTAASTEATVETTSTSEATTTTAATTTSEATTTSQATTTTVPPTSTSLAGPNQPLGEEELPGEDFDLFPLPGSVLAVIGVPFDDVLNVRLGPGIDFDVIATLGPLSNEFVSTGRARLLPSSIWFEGSTTDGLIGWVSSRFVAQMGLTNDLTSFVVEELMGIPSAGDMESLGLLVAESLASEDPKSDIVLVVPATVGDLGEVTYDVVGLGDDAVAGIRLHVFGEPTDGGFSLKSVESTDMCQPIRGTADTGACT